MEYLRHTLAVHGSHRPPNGGKTNSLTVRRLVLKFEKPLSNKCEGFYVSDTGLHGNIRIFAKIDIIRRLNV